MSELAGACGGSNCGLGVAEWLLLGDALRGCCRLEALSGVAWSRAALAPGLSRLSLRGAGLGDADAAALAALLPRAAATLTGLGLG